VKAVLALWAATANRQLLETQRSEPFLATQAAMIRASTELRMAQQELVEHFGRQFGFPTQAELDDVHRTVTGLRREMRTMQRAQRMSASATPPSASTGQPPAMPSTRRQNPKKRGAR
jgi:polyhydroxyalkanoate synthase subunit PhaE